MRNNLRCFILSRRDLYCVLLLTGCFFLQTCSTQSRETKAEQLLSEINEIASKKDNSVSEIPEKVRKDLSSNNIQRFPDSRQNIEIAVRQALPYYENDLQKFTLIAKKYEEMELLNLNPKYMESVSNQKRLTMIMQKELNCKSLV